MNYHILITLIMKKYLAPLEMLQHLKKVKTRDPLSIMMGLDVGRVFNGIALSDKTLTIAKVIKHINIRTAI